jgi:predicted HTH domain antitoxin
VIIGGQKEKIMSAENVTNLSGEINTLTIEYPQELLWALQQEPEEFAAQAQILLAVKLYETGKLSTGLAARVAGVPRSTFFYLLGQYGLSPFGQSPDELEDDLTHARTASHYQ